MSLPKGLIEVTENQSPGYHPLMNYEEWRVAVLNQEENSTYSLDNLKQMEYHSLTDEVFILLKGEATLFLSESKDKPGDIYSIKMEPLKCYNVKKDIWHDILLYDGGSVIIVENHNTSNENTFRYQLTEQDKYKIK